MASIPITYQVAQEHVVVCQAIEAKIRSSKSPRKNDPFASFKWSYNACIDLSNNKVEALLVATSQGVNWDVRLEEAPDVCFDYWTARGKQGLTR